MADDIDVGDGAGPDGDIPVCEDDEEERLLVHRVKLLRETMPPRRFNRLEFLRWLYGQEDRGGL